MGVVVARMGFAGEFAGLSVGAFNRGFIGLPDEVEGVVADEEDVDEVDDVEDAVDVEAVADFCTSRKVLNLFSSSLSSSSSPISSLSASLNSNLHFLIIYLSGTDTVVVAEAGKAVEAFDGVLTFGALETAGLGFSSLSQLSKKSSTLCAFVSIFSFLAGRTSAVLAVPLGVTKSENTHFFSSTFVLF